MALVLKRQAFTAEDALAVGRVWAAYSAGLFFIATVFFQQRCFLANKDMTPLWLAPAFGIPLNLGLDLWFAKLWGVPGIALGTTTVYLVYMLFNAVCLRRYWTAAASERTRLSPVWRTLAAIAVLFATCQIAHFSCGRYMANLPDSIVLLTDGENNAGVVDPESAARAAAAKGIKIYAIGVGTPGGAPVPVYSPMGQKFYLTDPSGRPMLAKVDEAGLKRIAELTGGTYFRAGDENALGEVYRKIASMEKKELTVIRITGYRELFVYPAGLALLLLVLGAFLAKGRLRVLS